jgi:restriction system protein|nr:MAG TPA: Restriction endonuclease [Caudoviricetes sp.]DAY98023.1 MAG TPA: Restriction endonuclease [Caudoviricetes sp.]
MKHVLDFYKKHKISAFLTFLWLVFMTLITVTGLANSSTRDAVEIGSGIFAGIVMFVPGAILIAVACTIISTIFGTFSSIIRTHSTDSGDVEPIIPPSYSHDNYTPAPTWTPEVIPDPPTVLEPQLPVYDTMEGHDFEYYCADLLRNDGFYNVEVTQGSGDQGIDILAEKAGIRYGIQCKCYSNNIGNKAVQEAFAGKTFYHCHVAAVLTNRYFTRSAKQLAEEDQVLLWDRDELERLVQNAES